MRGARLGELLSLERRFVFRVLPQVAVGARLLDLLRKHEVDLVVQALDFGLQPLLELVDHGNWEKYRAPTLRRYVVARSVLATYTASSYPHASQHPHLPRPAATRPVRF